MGIASNTAEVPNWPAPSDWTPLLRDEFRKDYFQKLIKFVERERTTEEIFPSASNTFRAFELTPFKRTKVVILGQDPYHGPGQAHGLSFSVPTGLQLPPSLKNIFRELRDDLDIATPSNGDLSAWATQGVLLLNSVLTVQRSRAHSHRGKGWETFTDSVLSLLGQREQPTSFVLWGNAAIKKKKQITNPRHCVLTSVHPSPLSAYRGFFGSCPFSKVNEFLAAHNMAPINWNCLASHEISELDIE